MHNNPLKERLVKGDHAFGTMAFEFFTAGLPQIVRSACAELLMFDMEHSGAGFETIKQQGLTEMRTAAAAAPTGEHSLTDGYGHDHVRTL